MSVIVWTGKEIAADRQATCADMRRQTDKLRRAGGAVFAWTGSDSGGLELMKWYITGADPAKWPSSQGGTDWTRLLIADPNSVREYEQRPVAIIHRKPPLAWGSGRDFAMGALAMGATAREAVKVACRYNVACGMGVTVLRLI